MLRDVISVEVLEPYRLRLRFDDGVEGVIDVAQEVPFQGIFEPLRDPDFFRQVQVVPDIGTIVWPNGADLDPLVLYSHVTGQPVAGPGTPVKA